MSRLRRAEQTARRAHGNDRNKHDGEIYIRHVERVVEHLRRIGADDETLIAAWLHDVVEDTPVTLEQIRAEFGDETAADVDALTHRPGEPRVDYYKRVGPRRRALMVKLSDGRDNQDPNRKAALDPATRVRLDKKYDLQNRSLAPWIIHHRMETK